jgi:DNA-binding Lrp family transcriptional regulator
MAEDAEHPELDDIDRRILQALNEDARQSYREISQQLDVALSTVSSHVKKLEQAGVIEGYIPVVDAKALGYELQAIVGVRVAHGQILEVQEHIAEDPRTFGVYDVTGEWDSMILGRFRDREDLNAFIKRIVELEDVERTFTNVVLNTVKEENRVAVPEAEA